MNRKKKEGSSTRKQRNEMGRADIRLRLMNGYERIHVGGNGLIVFRYENIRGSHEIFQISQSLLHSPREFDFCENQQAFEIREIERQSPNEERCVVY